MFSTMLQALDEERTPLTPPSIILWVGPKHSGKTTSAARLLQATRAAGFVVAGCLAPSVYANDSLLGFDVVNLHSGERVPLARRETGPGENRKFRFIAEGLALGNEALGPIATKDADLIIVDEYGP
jgi:nucleoside-triphosphatase THEP1